MLCTHARGHTLRASVIVLFFEGIRCFDGGVGVLLDGVTEPALSTQFLARCPCPVQPLEIEYTFPSLRYLVYQQNTQRSLKDPIIPVNIFDKSLIALLSSHFRSRESFELSDRRDCTSSVPVIPGFFVVKAEVLPCRQKNETTSTTQKSFPRLLVPPFILRGWLPQTARSHSNKSTKQFVFNDKETLGLPFLKLAPSLL